MKRAFTLPELLVSGLLTAIISVTLGLAFSSAFPTLEGMVTRIELDLRCRTALDRSTLVLQSAVPAFSEALYQPADGTQGTTVVFSSNEDFLHNPPSSWDPRTVGGFRTYSLGQSGRDLVLQELYATVPPQVLARNVSVTFTREGHTVAMRVRAQGSARNARWQSSVKDWSLETIIGLPAYAR